jgi:hypothetical protein
MSVKVDYISISIKYPRFYTWVKGDTSDNVKSELVPRFRKLFNLINEAKDLVQGGGRAPFNKSWFSAKCGFTYFESDKLNTSLLEITGKGCDYLRASGWLEPLLRDFSEDCTRIDIAVDFESDLDPRIFASERSVGRFQSHEVKVSSTGITVYIGSKDSARYARIYRYYHPHPRHNLLRVEHVYKGEYTIPVIKSVLDDGIEVCAVTSGNTFGWAHSLWQDAVSDKALNTKFRVNIRETRQGSTDRWLLKSVYPCLESMIRKGNREMVEFFHKKIGDLLERTK